MVNRVFAGFVISALLSALTPVSAQFATDFEDTDVYDASDVGVILTDQDDFYIPVVGSADWECFTYLDNEYGFEDNPEGGDQFVAGRGLYDDVASIPEFARAQKNVIFSDSSTWTIVVDIAVTFDGVLPTGQNIGSVSTQEYAPPGGGATFIALARWEDLDAADAWNADYVYHNSAGTAVTGEVPDEAFQELLTETWYRWSTSFDLDENTITRVSIEEVGGDDGPTAYEPTNWYLVGGSTGGLDEPSGFRLFAGAGTLEGNIVAIDNIDVFIDCDSNGIDDEVDLEDPDNDCDEDGILDGCQTDCDGNDLADVCEILDDPTLDCDDNGVLNVCDVDCDDNGLADFCEIEADPDLDCDDSGILDSCETFPQPISFVRGDPTGDGLFGLPDLIVSLEYQFIEAGGNCVEAMDFNDDGLINLTDVFDHAAFIFLDGADPAAPYPACGEDLDDDDFDCTFHCECA